MSLHRILEPEVMDSPSEALEYDSMDHSAVNQAFAADAIAAGIGDDVLDLGTGTAQIPVELCRLHSTARILAVDLAISMLELARYNVSVAGYDHRIQLQVADAKQLPFRDEMFSSVISNSIIHHVPDPLIVLREAVRVTQPGGLIFFRDLARPPDMSTVDNLVETYAKGATDDQRRLFHNSLQAALSLSEVRQLIAELGFPSESVSLTSDRHWTWNTRRPNPVGSRA